MEIEHIIADHAARTAAAFDGIGTRLDELDTTIKAIEAKANRPGPGIDGTGPEQVEHVKAFKGWMRKGVDDGLAALESKAMNVTTSADGGYAVPEQLDRTILDLLRDSGSLRAVANIVQIGGGDYKKLVNLHGAAVGWVGETSTRPETSAPTFAEVTPYMGELYANPTVTQRMLDDAFFDPAAWLAGELAETFALAENTTFVSGDGTNKPKGLLSYTVNTSTDGNRTFGHIEMVKTGVDGGFTAVTSSTSPADDLLATVHRLSTPYRANATWLMNSATLETVRKFKDAEGNLLWRAGLESGQPSTLLGYPVLELPDMPDVSSTTLPIAFGDFKRAYYIVDRMDTRILRDPYSNKPYVGFYATKRVGGMLVDSRAVKFLATRT